MSWLGIDGSATAPAAVHMAGSERTTAARKTRGVVRSVWTFDGEDLRGVDRLHRMDWSFRAWLRDYVEVSAKLLNDPVEVVVIEGYGFNTHRAHTMGEAGAVLKMAVWEFMAGKGSFVAFPPVNLKQFVLGKAVGEKSFMLRAALEEWGHRYDSDDVNDAVCCAELARALSGGTLAQRFVPKLEWFLPVPEKKAKRRSKKILGVG